MTPATTKRRLAAILNADVAGYSRLMAADEEATLASLKAHRAEVIDAKIAEHQGRIFKTTGDGVLAEFASVVDAVRCAAEAQEAMRGRNAGVPEAEGIVFRIGINVGDVIVDGDDLYGDGVNLAARVQECAEPGGIAISATVHDQLEGKTTIPFADAGSQALKNIARPVRIWRWAPDGQAPRPVSGPPPALPGKPSIAVLPFDNMSKDAEQDYFADGVTEEIITALSRVHWFFVIARNSTFAYKGRSPDVREVARDLGVRYVHEGSVRRAGNRVRIAAQLIQGATGKHMWAKRYDRELEDIFALQDEITETIVGEIEPEMSKAERQRARGKKTGNLDAWDAYQRGLWHLYRYTKVDISEARRLFLQAVEADPDLGPAHAGLAEADYYAVVYGHADSMAECRERALLSARRAVELDGEDAAARCTLGRIHYLRREHDRAVPELETAIALNPSLALAHYGLGAALVFSGRASESLPHLEMAIRLSLYDPAMGSFLVRLADAHLFLGRNEDSLKWAKEALRQPGFQ